MSTSITRKKPSVRCSDCDLRALLLLGRGRSRRTVRGRTQTLCGRLGYLCGSELKIRSHIATLWYHPHPHGETRDHVNCGLAGMFILDDRDDPASQALPHQYGVDDIPVIVQDRSFDGSGDMDSGDFGDTLLVNGTYGPFLEATTEAVRLRVLNAWAARVYNFGLGIDLCTYNEAAAPLTKAASSVGERSAYRRGRRFEPVTAPKIPASDVDPGRLDARGPRANLSRKRTVGQVEPCYETPM